MAKDWNKHPLLLTYKRGLWKSDSPTILKTGIEVTVVDVTRGLLVIEKTKVLIENINS